LERFDAVDRYEPGPTIFAQKPWASDSPAIVLQEDTVDGVAPSQPSFSLRPARRLRTAGVARK
jgi:hypothetical protein